MNILTRPTQLLLVIATIAAITPKFIFANIHAAESMSGYLGMAVDKVPDAVRAHLPEGIAETQGLLVTKFADDLSTADGSSKANGSPAADDGIQLYDVLITYDGEPINAPEIFIQKIRDDTPGRQVTFKLVRQGVIVSVLVTMGEQKTLLTAPVNNAPVKQTPAKQKSTSILPVVPVMNQYQQPYTGQRYPAYPPRGGGGSFPYNSMYPNVPRSRSYPAPNYNVPYQTPKVQPSVPALNIAGKPSFPMRQKIVKEKHAWGDKRNIWPDFYTGSTGNMWDSMMNAPFDMGRMPGGWRAPSLSTPDPVTIGDAVTNQIPPIAEEMGNMADFTD